MLVDHQQLHARLLRVADQMDPPPELAPHNDLRPDPARLQFEIICLRAGYDAVLRRLTELEKRLGIEHG